jgi:hypothetical protein
MAADPAGQAAHELAAALLYRLAGLTTDLVNTEHVLVSRLHEDKLRGTDGTAWFPATLTGLIQAAELTDGVRLADLIGALEPDRQAAATALAEIVRSVTRPAPEDAVIAENVRRWTPDIGAIAAACQPGPQAGAQALPDLDELAERYGWRKLVPVLQRIIAGERGEHLTDGLDPVDAAIARETLARVATAESAAER